MPKHDYIATGILPPEPFRIAGRSFVGEAVMALCRTFGRCRLFNACMALDLLPYDEHLVELTQWCHHDDQVFF
jgi:hypothetical protein